MSKTIDPLHPSCASAEGPIEIAPRTYWVGAYLPGDPFQCHAYLIEHGDQSVLVDPGSVLTIAEVLRKVEQVVPLSSIRTFLCSHQDPDITGALPELDRLVTRPDARVVTHWRTAALLKHLGLRMDIHDPEHDDWKIDLGGRVLRVILTPYLHFAGAICTLDEQTGTLFSSDLFGGFTSGPDLYAEDEGYFEEIRAFHEHYMPSREILVHGILRLQKHAIARIAPQHGRVIPERLVQPIMERLKGLECGLFLMTRGDSDVRRLMSLQTMMRDVVHVLTEHRDFSAVADGVLARVSEVLPVDALDFYVDPGDGGIAHLCEANGYRADVRPPPAPVAAAFAQSCSWGHRHHEAIAGDAFADDRGAAPRIVVPLYTGEDAAARALAVLRLVRPLLVSDDLDDLLGQLAIPLGIAVEREVMHRKLEAEHDKLARALDDLARTQNQLLQARKLEAIGQLAAGVAHEINTPVQYVSDNVTFLGRAFTQLSAVAHAAQTLAAQAPASPERDALERALRKAKIDFIQAQAPRAIEQARDGLARVAGIVGAMKEFSHPSSKEKELVDLRRLVETTLVVAKNEWKYVAEVETSLDGSVPLVPALRNEVGQVLLNLLVNAAHAIADKLADRPGDKGVIRVSTRTEGAFAVIEVSDNGTGIADGIRDRIFDPFFTTKPVGKGTGQGLAIAHNVVVDRHGGRIDLRTELGRGSTFTVKLPLEQQSRSHRPPREARVSE